MNVAKDIAGQVAANCTITNRGLMDRLRTLLEKPLPGRASQRKYSPQNSYGRHFGPPPTHAKPAAVLLFLYYHDHQWWLPLTVRPNHLPDHAGQISFPGGRVESGESFEQTAVREFCEELGVSHFTGSILGSLSELYIYGSDFRVIPYVASCEFRPNFIPSPDEVHRLMEVPLADVVNPVATESLRIERGNYRFQAPCWRFGDDRVWGATAMILSEFADLARQAELRPDIHA